MAKDLPSLGILEKILRCDTGKWQARIGVNGRDVYLGLFDSISDAILARQDAKREHGYHSNHGRDGVEK